MLNEIEILMIEFQLEIKVMNKILRMSSYIKNIFSNLFNGSCWSWLSVSECT